MNTPARLTGALLARKGRATPADGLATPDLAWSQPLPAWPPATTTSGGPEPGPSPRAARATTPVRGPAEARVALTLRLDPERHTRLKIVAARRRCRSQDLLIAALDSYLDGEAGDCACLRGCGRN